MDTQNQRKTRRTVLAATGVAAAFGLAGCVGGNDDDDETEPDDGTEGPDDGETGQTQRDEQTVTLLVEGVGGHGDKHDGEEERDHSETEGEHDDEHSDEQHDYGHEGLTSEELGHACNHIAEVEEFGAEDVEAGGTTEEAPHLDEVHHPYSVTFEGESGYVRFELGDHAHSEEDEHSQEEEQEDEHDKEGEHSHDGELLAFFTRNGVAGVVEGELVYSETEAVESCGPIDRYVIVETHDGSAVVELTAGL